MAQYNFKIVYCPSVDVAVDESTYPFCGRVNFQQYKKSKPNKFHIKLFIVSENDAGYMISFFVYTGSKCNELIKRNAAMDPNCTITTKTVMGLLDTGNLPDMHRHVCFDNWFKSVEFLLEMLACSTYGA